MTDDVSFFEGEENLSPSLRGDDIALPDKDVINKLSSDIKSLADYKTEISKRLGVTVCATTARSKKGLDNLTEDFSKTERKNAYKVRYTKEIEDAVKKLVLILKKKNLKKYLSKKWKRATCRRV